MTKAFLVLGLLLHLTGEDRPQLLVIAGGDVNSCRPAPPGWDAAAPYETSLPELVRGDVDAYFRGLSVQVTPFLEATWHGVVRFCTSGEASDVLHQLAESVVRPGLEERTGADFAPGAEPLLAGLAGPELQEALEAIDPQTDEEVRRREAAITFVREAIASGEEERPHSEVAFTIPE